MGHVLWYGTPLSLQSEASVYRNYVLYIFRWTAGVHLNSTNHKFLFNAAWRTMQKNSCYRLPKS
jgi:hypothetical protein